MIKTRNEKEPDYKMMEDITRRAFYNLHVPEYGEHYLVHIMRGHEDFIPELDFVLGLDGQVIGSIIYTKVRLVDESGTEKEILTFGPVSVAPEYQRKGCGKMLMERPFERAVSLGYDVIVMFGGLANYVGGDFKSCKKFNICLEGGSFPAVMMVRELVPGALGGRRWVYRDSPVMAISEEEARLYDDSLGRIEEKRLPSQEEFYIMNHSFIKQGASGKTVTYVGLCFIETDETLGNTWDEGRIYDILMSCFV